MYSVSEVLSIKISTVSYDGSVSGKGFASNLNLTVVGVSAYATNVSFPPSTKVIGNMPEVLAKPAHSSASPGKT